MPTRLWPPRTAGEHHASLSVHKMPYLVGQEQFKSCCSVGWIIEKSGFKVLIPNFKAHISWAAPVVRTVPPWSREAAVRSDWSISPSRMWRRKLRCFQGSDRKSSISEEHSKQNQAICSRNTSTFLTVRTNSCVVIIAKKKIFLHQNVFFDTYAAGHEESATGKTFPSLLRSLHIHPHIPEFWFSQK